MDRRAFLLMLAAGGICLAAGPERTRDGMMHDRGQVPSRERPLVVQKELRSVRIYTETNGKSYEKTNPHWGVVFKDGKLADKGILRAYCSPVAFYDALVQIGARPGNDLTEEDVGRTSGGDRLIVTASLPGSDKEIPLERVFSDSSGKGFSIRFGGNRKAAEEERTGCIMCLESCWVGITSNAAYPLIGGFRRFVSPNSQFSGMPELRSSQENRPVILSYRLA